MAERASIAQRFKILEKFLSILETAKNAGDNVFDVFPVSFILTDDAGKVLKANVLAQQLVAKSEDQILGEKIVNLVPSEIVSDLLAYYQKSAKEGHGALELETKTIKKGDQDSYTFWQINKIARQSQYRFGLHVIVASDVTEIRRNHQRITAFERDLEVSQAIQRHLLPKVSNFENEHFKVAGYYRAAEKVSGDWWWYEATEPKQLNFLLGDVTGHGLGSAMVTAKIATAYHVLCRNFASHQSMKELLNELNRQIYGLIDPYYSMSMVAAICNAATDEVELCFCAANPVTIFPATGGAQHCLRGGDPVGWKESILIGQQRTAFQSGDRLFAWTDGVREFVGRQGERFTARKLTRLVDQFRHDEPIAACQAIVEAIDHERQSCYGDDMSFVIIDRK